MEPDAQPDCEAAAEAQPRQAGWFLPTLCVLNAIVALAFWLLIRYAADRWWPATVLLYTPRWPLLVPLLVLVPWAWRTRRRWLWLPVLTGLFVLFPFMDFNVPWHRPAAAAPKAFKLRLLTCNLHRIELTVASLNKYIEQIRPDVVAFQDYSNWDEMPCLSAPEWHTYQVGNQIFLASKYPIVHVHDLNLERIEGNDDNEFPRRFGIAVCFDLQTPAGLLHVVNVHLVSPHKGLEMLAEETEHGVRMLEAGSIRRRNESALVESWISAQSGPVIAAGDFNMPAESPIYREFWSKYPDAFRSAGWGYGFTHLSVLSELRIDHVLMTDGTTCTGVQIGPACGTPHRPLVADLLIPSEH